ncbi:MAG: alpha/beta fold hydrolase, partial [Caulobacterales bacterium]
MAKFLLVHGGLHGAWCWTKTIPYLKARGHEVVAIDLPGLGDDPTPPEKTGLSDYGDAVAKAARAMGGKP